MKALQILPAFAACRLTSFTIINRVATRLITQSESSEWTETPEYPPIRDIGFKQVRRDKKLAWYDKIRDLPTVEQKLVEMNMPRYYGYPMFFVSDQNPKLNALECIRYITRSHIVEGIPEEYYKNLESDAEAATKAISNDVEDLISFHFNKNITRVKRGLTRQPVRIKTGNFIRDLNALVVQHFAKDKEHICKMEADVDPRIEGSWQVGGFYPRPGLFRARDNNLQYKGDADELVDRWFRSSVHPALSIRASHPLPDVVPRDDSLSTKEDMPKVPLNPKSCGMRLTEKRAVVTPGFWPGCELEHGHLFYHSREHMVGFKKRIQCPDFIEEAMDQSLLLAAFTQAHSYAFYQGFSPFSEMSFPIVQQSISTDGQFFKFGVFQMNTCCLVMENATENPYNNVMWMTGDLPLFEAIEDGKVKGLNESVIKNIVQMYLKEGEAKSEAYPYEANGYKYLADHEATDEYKHNFQKFLLRLTSEVPALQPKPNMQMWEYIYMVKFNTRPMFDKKRRFWSGQCEQKPWERRLDDYVGAYIPRAIRANKDILYKPVVNSEELFVHPVKVIRRSRIHEGAPELTSMNQTDDKYTRKSFMKYMTVREKKTS